MSSSMFEPAGSQTRLTRRAMIGGGLAAGLGLFGLSWQGIGAAPAGASGSALPKMRMYKSPTCGCCGKWAEAAQKAGFTVEAIAVQDIHAVKAKAGVPDELVSCHTTLVGGYVVEGHVPLDAVKRLIAQRPNVRGIAVPGMPLGSPGMEMPDGRREDFTVLAFGGAGKVRPF